MTPVNYKTALTQEGVTVDELSAKGKMKATKIAQLEAKINEAKTSNKIMYRKQGQITQYALRVIEECKQDIEILNDDILDEIAIIAASRVVPEDVPVDEIIDDLPEEEIIVPEPKKNTGIIWGSGMF